MSKKCAIVGPDALAKMARRYLGEAPNLSHDETQILLFSLCNESRANGGLMAEAYRKMDDRLRDQNARTGMNESIRLGRETESERFACEAEQSVCSEKFRLSAEDVRGLVLAIHYSDGRALKKFADIFENAKYVEVGK